jgi:uncharacterized protein (TIGR00730 family)
MTENTNICVYCGSLDGNKPEYADDARAIGRSLVDRGLGLVYGGGRVGLMGILAESVLERGGRAIGVIPQPLADREVAHLGLTELHVVADMHERKALMASRASAFLTLPGGIGTFEELFETLSWAMLGLHHKPFGLLNTAGYYNPMLAMLAHGVTEGFVRPPSLDHLIVSSDPAAIVDVLIRKAPPASSSQLVDFRPSE